MTTLCNIKCVLSHYHLLGRKKKNGWGNLNELESLVSGCGTAGMKHSQLLSVTEVLLMMK